MPPQDRGEKLRMRIVIVETGHELELFAAESEELLLVLHRDLLDGFEAGEEETYVGEMARGIAAGLAHDPKAVERQLASPG